MSAEIIPVQVCVVCGKMRVERAGDRSLLVPKGGAKMLECYPCAFWVTRVSPPVSFKPETLPGAS